MRLGWYVHHHGSGHLERALAVTAALPPVVRATTTGLSTLPRPGGWPGPWVRLPADDGDVRADQQPTAGGRLHWAPHRHAGVTRRAAAVSAWIDRTRPHVLVSDVSVETTVLARLHGVTVVSVVLPGSRGDAAHRLGFDVSESLLAAWPATATPGMVSGLDPSVVARVVGVGAISRFAGWSREPVRPRTVTVLLGSGGDDLPPGWLARAEAQCPDWRWTVLGGREGAWVADPWPAISSAEVVVSHAGQGALADVATAGRPAVVLPMERPFDEQAHTARALADGDWPAVVAQPTDALDWPELLHRARLLDGGRWRAWAPPDAAGRMADEVLSVLRTASEPAA